MPGMERTMYKSTKILEVYLKNYNIGEQFK